MASKRFPARIQDHVTTWFKKTEAVRKVRSKMLEHYANAYYAGGLGTRTPQPLNLIDRGVQIIAPFLVMTNPRVMITPRFGLNNLYVRPFAMTLELALSHLFHEIRLAQRTLRPVVIDSLFGMGITKTGTMHEYDVDIQGYTNQVGQPYCDRIDFNDYIGDIGARNREEMKIEGHKFRVPLDYIRDSGLFKHYDRLQPDQKLYGETDPDTISKPDVNPHEFKELHPTVELYSIWLPEEGLEIFLPPDGQGDKIMRTVEWEGPEGGPYDVLGYKLFPNSTLPIAPVYTWLDINKIANVIACKMKDDCLREKTIGLYELADETDAEVIKDARNGDLIGVRNPEATKEMTLGGFNEKSMPFLQYLEHQYAISYSNLYGIGGRGTQANTLGQEQILQYNATRALDDMVDQFHQFVKSVTRKLAWFLWTDPMIQMPVIKKSQGITVPTIYSESAQEGDFFDYTFDIDPYSMSRMNPDMKFNRLLQFVTGIVMPLVPLAQMQGSTLNVDALLREFAEYLGEDVDSWWLSAMPQSAPNPYAQEQKKQKNPGQTDDRMGASPASREANSNGFQMSNRANKPSPPQR